MASTLVQVTSYRKEAPMKLRILYAVALATSLALSINHFVAQVSNAIQMALK